jgi:hypothetical protein
MDGSPAPRQTFTVGLDALAAACEEQQARQEQAARAAQERADRYNDPGRVISTTLLAHRIPEHVNAALARPTWAEGEGQDRRRLFKRLRYEVAPSLVLRGWSAEEFCDVMPGYTLPRRRGFQYCMVAPVEYYHPHNALWDEITTRGRRELPPSRYEPMVLRAFKHAEERIGEGMIPDVDQPAYGEALAGRWTTAMEAGRVRLSPMEVKVVGWVCSQMRSRGYLNIACPAREVAKELGVADPKVAWRVLKKLADDRVLICRSKGHAIKRLAAIYCLSPQLPGGPGGPRQTPTEADSKHYRAERTERVERNHSHGTDASLGPVFPQVKVPFGESHRMPHTNKGTTLTPPG